MKIGVLGSGDVAKVLGGGFLKHGHDVMMGTREPAKLADWAAQNPKGRLGGFAQAAEFAELVVLAVKGAVASDALRAAFAQTLKDPGFLAEAEKMGVEVQHVGGEEIQALVERIYASPPEVIARAKAVAE